MSAGARPAGPGTTPSSRTTSTPTHRRVTLHDLETRQIYLADFRAEVSDLREQFAARGIRSQPLDRYLASPENGADLSTLSTALLEMASRLER